VRTLCTAAVVSSFAAAASGGQVFGSEVVQDALVSVDLATFTGTTIGPYSNGSFDLNGLAGDSASGVLYGLDAGSGRLYSVDPTTAQATAIPNAAFGGNANGLAYDAGLDRLWVSNNGGNLSFYDLGTGVFGSLGQVGTATAGLSDLEGLAFDNASGTLYAINDRTDRIYAVDTQTLFATEVSGPLAPALWRGLTFDDSTGRLVASSVGSSSIFAEIDPATGTVVRSGTVSGIGNFSQGLAYLIPAPSTGVALIAGAVCMGRRRVSR
jgi:DNA-binding beta-propeller fold protein YncE